MQSLHVPEQEFEEMYGYERPGKDKTLVFYCKAGVRARTAAGLALHAGWTSVGEYRGSWLDWAENQGPVEKVNGGQVMMRIGAEDEVFCRLDWKNVRYIEQPTPHIVGGNMLPVK